MSRKELSATMHGNYGTRLQPMVDAESIPMRWQGTPIEDFIAVHNYGGEIKPDDNPHLLIVTCIEYRFSPQIPPSFAYVARKAGGRLIGSELELVYTLAKGVRHIALVGHNDCGMTKVAESKPLLVDALVEQGWDRTAAVLYVNANAPRYMIGDEIDTLEIEYLRLSQLFKNVEIAPLFVSIASSHLHLPTWYFKYMIASPTEGTGSEVDLEKIASLLNL